MTTQKDNAVGVMQDFFPNGGRDFDDVCALYDAIAAGKIPGVVTGAKVAELEQPIRQHFLAGYDDGHSRGLTMGKLYKGDDQTILHRRACADAYIAGDEGE
ncbi:hypothetical protein [Serratia fonticola]